MVDMKSQCRESFEFSDLGLPPTARDTRRAYTSSLGRVIASVALLGANLCFE